MPRASGWVNDSVAPHALPPTVPANWARCLRRSNALHAEGRVESGEWRQEQQTCGARSEERVERRRPSHQHRAFLPSCRRALMLLLRPPPQMPLVMHPMVTATRSPASAMRNRDGRDGKLQKTDKNGVPKMEPRFYFDGLHALHGLQSFQCPLAVVNRHGVYAVYGV